MVEWLWDFQNVSVVAGAGPPPPTCQQEPCSAEGSKHWDANKPAAGARAAGAGHAPMTVIPSSVVRVYAESIGLANLSEDVLAGLAQDLEYRVRELVQDAAKYMHHAHRTRLSVDDLNMALQARSFDPLLGYDTGDALTFRMVPSTSVYWVPSEEVDLERVLQEAPPRAPQPLALTSHWLAVDGIQPQISENPSALERSLVVGGADRDAGAALLPTARKDLLEEAEIKPAAKHMLSRELQLYNDTIVADLLQGESEARTEAALAAVAKDAGIQQLLPYFVQFVAEMVPKHLRALSRLHVLMRLFAALLQNPHLFVEPYVCGCAGC